MIILRSLIGLVGIRHIYSIAIRSESSVKRCGDHEVTERVQSTLLSRHTTLPEGKLIICRQFKTQYVVLACRPAASVEGLLCPGTKAARRGVRRPHHGLVQISEVVRDGTKGTFCNRVRRSPSRQEISVEFSRSLRLPATLDIIAHKLKPSTIADCAKAEGIRRHRRCRSRKPPLIATDNTTTMCTSFLVLFSSCISLALRRRCDSPASGSSAGPAALRLRPRCRGFIR